MGDGDAEENTSTSSEPKVANFIKQQLPLFRLQSSFYRREE